MEAVAKLIDPPSLLQESKYNPNLGILSSFLQDVMIRNPGILEQILQDVLFLDEHLHLVAMRLQGSNGVLVIMEMGRMAEIDKDSHDNNFS